MFLFYMIGLPIALLAGTILLTLMVEFPIVYCTGITRNKKYIVAVNALTNVCLNAGIIIVFLFDMSGTQWKLERDICIWTLFAELTLIPVAEAVLYFMISKKSSIKVLLVTYVANFASFIFGLFVTGLLTDRGIHGISRFFIKLFGGFRW
ncbi:MAG: hypothetical protein IK018_07045 [Lachnospiraceae bacterium]|nr:hypothetical protein [Lachnospiraceae bacterium]